MNKIKRFLTKEITMNIMIFLICFLIFSLALISFFPGLVSSDGVDQIYQARNNVYYNAHPIAHTFVVGNLANLGGLWIPCLFQILVFSIIWTYGMKVLRKYNDKNSFKLFEVLFTIFICIIPINLVWSVTVLKDVLYSYAMLLSIIYVYVGIKENWNYSYSQIIFLVLSNVMVMKFRHNGLPIGAIMIFICLVLNIVKNKNWKKLLTFILSSVLLYTTFTLPEKVIVNRVDKESMDVLFSTKVYLIGEFLHEEVEFEQEDLEFLDRIYDIDLWKKNFDHYTGSPILFDSVYQNKSAFLIYDKEAYNKFNEIFWKYVKQNPTETIKHFALINSIWWSPYEFGPLNSLFIDNEYVSEMCNGEFDTHPLTTTGYWKLATYIYGSYNVPVVYTYVYRPAVHIIIGLVLCIILWVRNKKFSYMLLMLPSLLNIGTYILLISSQDLRYFYPSFLTGYIVFAIYMAERKKKAKVEEKIVSDELDMEKVKENNKVLVIIPAYNEEESIEKVVNSVYAQGIDNLDVIVVNDGSKDNTYFEAKKTKAIVIDSPNNLGIGGAVQTGYLYAYQNGYNIAIQIDADGQHDPKFLKDIINEIEKGNDLVIGSRFVKKSDYKQTFFRMLGINVISFIIKIKTGKKIYDTTSGYRASNRNIIKEFVKYYPYDYPEPCTNMTVIQKGYKVSEIPVEMKQRETGQSFVTPLKSISYMFKVIMYLLVQR